jgi:hypothetical protein
MGRHSLGELPLKRSDTVLFGHIASRLEGVDKGGLDAWAQVLGIQPGAEVLRRRPDAAERLQGGPGARSAIRPWLSLDWRELDFFLAIARLRITEDSNQLNQLEAVRGVIELLACRQAGELFVTVVYQRRREQESLKLRLAEFGEVLGWSEVDDHRPAALISTIRALARDAAAREGLRLRQ